MPHSTTTTNDAVNTGATATATTAKRYQAPTFTRLGKVEELTGQTTRRTTTRPGPTPTPTPNKNGRAS